jgi:hypothetical protein
VDDAAVGEDDGEAEDVFAHGAVFDGCGSGGARGGHAAEGGVGAGVDEEGEAGVFERLWQLLAGDAGFDGGVHVVDADAEDAVHLAHVEEMPPRRAWTWPSSEVPAPKGTTGR